jgi:hypothetical protein
MARKRWEDLSPPYRRRLERQGITKSGYESGVSVTGARGHARTPEKPSRASYNPVKYADYSFANQTAEDEDFTPLTYDPTKTTWPANGWNHRRTTAAGYNSLTRTLDIEFFTNGAVYRYGTERPVPRTIALAFRRTDSPGKFINSTLNSYGYERIR